MAWLVGLDGVLAGRKFPLDAPFLVGRGPFNHVILDDARISRHHAKVSPEPGGCVVYDLDSANGTFVNDVPTKRHLLAPGDLVRFGPFRFRFESDGEASSRGRASAVPPSEELTRRGFDAPTRIVGQVDAQLPTTLIGQASLLDLEEADRKLRTLFAFVHAIAATLDAAELLDRFAQSLLDAFPSAELAMVYTFDAETNTMQPRRALTRDSALPLGSARSPENADAPLVPLPAELYLEVVQRGKALLSAPISLEFDDGEADASGLSMHAPMLYRGQVLGVLAVKSSERASFTQGDLDLLTALASHAALAQQNTKMYEESLARERLAQDLVLAQQIQKSFLPSELPDVAPYRFVAEYRPAHSVGGDFYDVFWQSPERIGFVVGDVSGKGVSAALLMARVSSDLRTAMLTEREPAAALNVVNRAVVARGQHDIFVTALCVSLDVRRRHVVLANAGHMPPYVRRLAEGDLRRVDEGTSSPLGLFDDIVYVQAELDLEAGDTLVLTTDGVHEATNERGAQLGFEGLEAVLRVGSSDPDALVGRVMAAVRAHVAGGAQYDDLTLLCCGLHG
jgi:phosphoserine phosphatase RsbU/P